MSGGRSRCPRAEETARRVRIAPARHTRIVLPLPPARRRSLTARGELRVLVVFRPERQILVTHTRDALLAGLDGGAGLTLPAEPPLEGR